MSNSDSRDEQAKQAAQAFERVAAEGPDKEKLGHEWAGARTQVGIPTVFSSGDGSMKFNAPPTQIVSPSGHALNVFGSQRALTCGSCKYFDLESGRREIVRQKFGEKLVKEFEWKLKHLGADVDSLGLCGASGGQMATSFVSAACDQYRPRGG